GRDGVLGVLDSESREEDLEELEEKAEGRPYVVLVDDAELVYDTPLDEALEAFVKKGADGGVGLVAAGTSDT
ncbi:hypothetical protein G3I39_09295, partial [Streptomyces fulvissimus]